MVSALTVGDILAKLRVLREELAMRQEHLAARLGVDRSTYVRKELGSIPITTDEWLALSKALDRDPSYFFSSSSKPAMGEGGLALRERLLVKLYRSLRAGEQDDLVATVYLKFKGIRRKAVREAVRLLKES